MGNNPVAYIMSTGGLTATGQEWVNKLVEFSFSLHYKPSKKKTLLDALGHTSEQTHLEHIQLSTKTVPVEMVKTSLDGLHFIQETRNR